MRSPHPCRGRHRGSSGAMDDLAWCQAADRKHGFGHRRTSIVSVCAITTAASHLSKPCLHQHVPAPAIGTDRPPTATSVFTSFEE